jgi:hypothetical protein
MADPIKPETQGLRPASKGSKVPPTVTAPILPGSPGRVLCNGSEWLAVSTASNPINIGEAVKVIRRKGGTITVQPLSKIPITVRTDSTDRRRNSSLPGSIMNAATGAVRFLAEMVRSIADVNQNAQNSSEIVANSNLDLPSDSIINLEQRLSIVENELRNLQDKSFTHHESNWLQQITGSFKGDTIFEEILAYGKAVRAGDELLPKTGAELVDYWERIGAIGSRLDIPNSQEQARSLRDQAEHRERT